MRFDLRIVLVGKTGAGKSATGNTILGREAFGVGYFHGSTTEKSVEQQTVKGAKDIIVIDTPGLFHTSLTEKHVKTEIEKSLQMSAPGPHVFLLVIRLGRFKEEEKNAVKWIQKNFGEDVKRFTMMLFTGADKLEKTVEEFLQKNHLLKKLVDECEGRYHALNNMEKKDHAQVTELLEKINTIMYKNREGYYTRDMFKKTQKKIVMRKILRIIPVLACFFVFYQIRKFWY